MQFTSEDRIALDWSEKQDETNKSVENFRRWERSAEYPAPNSQRFAAVVFQNNTKYIQILAVIGQKSPVFGHLVLFGACGRDLLFVIFSLF